MSVSSIFSSSSDTLAQLYTPASATDTSSLFALTGLSPAISSSTTASSAIASTSTSGTASSTSVSSQAKLLSQLQSLQTSNPAEFQKVTADISTQLQAAARQAGGSQGQALSSLATKFQQASQTGSLTPLQGLTTQSGTSVHGHRHGGGHHHGGASAASTNSTTDTSDTSSTTAADSVFNAASLTSDTPTATSPASSALSSASSLAASAYQQFSGQGIGSVANSIIGQVLNTNLGTSTTGSVSLSA